MELLRRLPTLSEDKDTPDDCWEAPGDLREVRGDRHKESEASGLRAATAGQGAAARHKNATRDSCLQTQFSGDPDVRLGLSTHHSLRLEKSFKMVPKSPQLEFYGESYGKSRKAVSCSLGKNLKKERRYYLVKPNLKKRKFHFYYFLEETFYQI